MIMMLKGNIAGPADYKDVHIVSLPIDILKIPNHIPRVNYARLAESMAQFGQVFSIEVATNLVVLNGINRVLAAKGLGWKTVNCIILPAIYSHSDARFVSDVLNPTAEPSGIR